MSSKKIIVDVNSLSFSYSKRSSLLLKKIDFKVFKGEFISIVGPNGSGKTTLFKLLLGFLKQNMGDIRWDESAKLGYVPQFSRLDEKFPITAWEVILMGQIKGLWGYPSPKKQLEARDILKEVDLWHQRNEPFFSLSGGQKQRILIARALYSQANVLLLDEPTASLDTQSSKQIYSLLKRFQERGNTIFAISHDIHFVSSMTDRVFCLEGQFSIHQTLKYLKDKYDSLNDLPLESQRVFVCHNHNT